MNPRIGRLLSSSGKLQRIVGRRLGNGRYDRLAFVFSEGVLSLRADDDTDEVTVDLLDAAPAGCEEIEDELLRGLEGYLVDYAWEMTNQRGYSDAFQIRFRHPSGREETRQFEAAASAIDVFLLLGRADYDATSRR